MKKIFALLITFFSPILVSNAKEVLARGTDFYYRYNYYGENEVHNITLYYDKDDYEPVFALDPENINIDGEFEVSSIFNESMWREGREGYNLFSALTYYGYKQSLTDEYYALTQISIWKEIYYLPIVLCDESGEEIDISKFDDVINKSKTYARCEDDFRTNQYAGIWETRIYYFNREEKFIYPDNPNFDIYENGESLYITGLVPGEYDLPFKVSYDGEVACYNNGTSTLCRSSEEPVRNDCHMKYNISGVKFKVNENVTNIERLGDVKMANTYDLFIYQGGNKPKASLKSGEEVYIRDNLEYVIKNTSNSPGVKSSAERRYKVTDQDVSLDIDKEIITKKINFNIKDDLTYEVYLKSNNELYETVNKDNSNITLPYGIYSIRGKDTLFEEDLDVLTEEEETIELDNQDLVKVEEQEESNKEASDVTKVKDEKEEEKEIKEEVGEEQEMPAKEKKEEINLPNPKTGDDIILYLFLLILCLISVKFCKTS